MTGRPMTAAEEWTDDADAAVAGSDWRCVDFHRRGGKPRGSFLTRAPDRPTEIAQRPHDHTTSTVRNKNTKNHERCNHQEDHEKRRFNDCGVLHIAS
jgi:hypothetical protein